MMISFVLLLFVVATADKSSTNDAELLEVIHFDHECPDIDTAMKKRFVKDMDMFEDSDPLISDIRDGTFTKDGKVYTLDNMFPQKVFADEAKILVNGEEVERPPPTVFSKRLGSETILVTVSSGEIDSVMISDADGKTTYMKSITPCAVAEVDAKQVDSDLLSDKWSILSDDGEYADDEQHRTLVEALENRSNLRNNRNLQECKEGVVGVAVAADSTFCDAFGSANAAIERVEDIMARVSLLYQVSGLCQSIVTTFLELDCDGSRYDRAVSLNRSGCGNSGLLQEFRRIWLNDRSGVRRNAAMFFSGTGLECSGFFSRSCVIGCASLRGLCSSLGFGVNYVTFSSNIELQAILVAHELGHVLGSPHDPTSNRQFIMEAAVNPAPLGFSSFSRNSISDTLDRGRQFGFCQAFDEDDDIVGDSNGPSTPRPTPRPTPQPTPQPTPPSTPRPTPQPTPLSSTPQPTPSPTPRPPRPFTPRPTRPSTPPPTPSPTPQPTPPQSVPSPPDENDFCSDGELIDIEIVLDNRPWQTLWAVQAESTTNPGSFFYVGFGGPYFTSGRVINWTRCRFSTFTNPLYFVIQDFGGNGLCCSNGNGSYTIRVNGEVVASGGDFGRSVVEEITSNFDR